MAMTHQSSADFHNGGDDDGRSDESIDIATLQEFSHLLQSQRTNLHSQSSLRRQIQRVPPDMRRRRSRSPEQVYDPVMVSFGPYHHGHPDLRRAEDFKHLCLDRHKKRQAFLYSKILDQIHEIKATYAEISLDDKSLALMMLLDASIIIDFIHNFLGLKGSSFSSWQRCLGVRSGPLMMRDLMVSENQIPFRVLTLIIGLIYDGEEAALFLPKFLSLKTAMELEHVAIIIRETEDPPLHFLEAYWRVLVKKICSTSESFDSENRFLLSGFSMREEKDADTGLSYTHRSVMDLKAKGIRVRPNSTTSLREIAFRPNGFFSHLHLPIQYISDLTCVIWSNMIAFEVLPNGTNTLVVLSYAVFMKSLIQRCDDVKELQEKGVLLNRLANLEKVVELMKEIETFGLHDHDVFKDVKRRIEMHCRSRARTWAAELVYTRFRTPWTAIAFFAAVILLCLAFLHSFHNPPLKWKYS